MSLPAILLKEGRKALDDLVPTDAERVDLYSGLIAYAGTYSIDGDKVSHHIDASWNQSWTGTTHVRQFDIHGNSLFIRTLPSKNPVTGKKSSAVLIWKRLGRRCERRLPPRCCVGIGAGRTFLATL
ncbi:lipocalin-like domain-containing protein [Paraburkholderia sp. RL18-085-BIA-A]|uniref:lipocalin-like domain-containing protein n=1 Tax=Paraburkholderia sp. RL18-085-BIA-A TaxID=3031633 RepID=UPI0038BDFDDE